MGKIITPILPPIRTPFSEVLTTDTDKRPGTSGDPSTATRPYWMFFERANELLQDHTSRLDADDVRLDGIDKDLNDLEKAIANELRSGTHAARLAAAPDPPGALWVETDRNEIVYQAQTVAGAAAWVFVTGAMYGTVIAIDQRPTGLGANDTGLIFLSTDSVSVRWDGSSWKQLNRIIDAGDFSTNPRSQTVWKAQGQGAVSVHCVGVGNQNLAFGAFYDAGWKAADTAVVVFSHEGNALLIKGSTGNVVGGAPALPTLLSIDLTTGNVAITGTITAGNLINVIGGAPALQMNGTQIVITRRPLPTVPSGGAVVDVEARNSIVSIIQRLEAGTGGHGLWGT